jgi:two-component system sensor histidine kinase DesK
MEERRRKRGAMVGSGFGLIFLGVLVTEIWSRPIPVWLKATVYLALLLYAGIYIWLMYAGISMSHRRRAWFVATEFVLGILPAVLLESPNALTYLTFAVAAGVMLLPLRISRLLALGAIALQILTMWAVNGSVNWGLVWVLIGVSWGLSAFFALIYTVNALRAARTEIQDLAVAEERERLARDLHDILGHSLTTITVKAGLARRQLESGDAGAASREVRDVEDLGRQALADVRATVSNYRTASLPSEIAGARISLQAAEITADLPRAVDNVDPKLQEVFGYVVREAVTNVIRHSHASRCEIRLGDRWVEINDNGSAGNGSSNNSATDGNGLTGLRERLEIVGGELAAGRADGGGFRVRATVPDEGSGS